MDIHNHAPARFSRRLFLLGSAAVASASFAPGLAEAASALTAFAPNGGGAFDHAAFNSVLNGAVIPDAEGYNRVDYKALKSRSAALKAVLAQMQLAAPSSFSRTEAKAFWINLYNAKTLDVVLDNYPVASIKKINLGGGGLFGSGPWSAKILSVEGQELSLDDVEHRILRPLFKDPMVHYALNCASYSCPNLSAAAFTAKNTAAQMQANAAAYINHKRGVSVAGAAITASKIYSWYGADFGGKSSLKAHWMKFAAPEKAAAIDAAQSVSFGYDWRLNDVRG
jgi:Protein of unknown function, DUF547